MTLQSHILSSELYFFKYLLSFILKEQFLPYYIRSNLKLICHGTNRADAEQFDAFIEDCLQNEERKEILEVGI